MRPIPGRPAAASSIQRGYRRRLWGLRRPRRSWRRRRSFGGGNRGRVTFSLTDTITFVDKVKIGPGSARRRLPSWRRPRARRRHSAASCRGAGGLFQQRARCASQRQLAQRDEGRHADRRHSPFLASRDLRPPLFANPGDIPELAVKHPWLRGTQVQLKVDNIFNSRPKVHDAAGGAVPLSFQPDLLDPLGRTIMISFRKLFLPNPRAGSAGSSRRCASQRGGSPG